MLENLEKRGYEDADGTDESGTECIEDNECRDGTHTCPANSYCVNTDASYNCDCYDGYYFGDNICNNINECFESDHGCSEHAECVDTPGSYTCDCHDGFKPVISEALIAAGEAAYGRDNEGCIDIDECEDNSLNNCDIEAEASFYLRLAGTLSDQ